MFTLGTTKMHLIRVRHKNPEPIQNIAILDATINRPANIRASEFLLSIADENAEFYVLSTVAIKTNALLFAISPNPKNAKPACWYYPVCGLPVFAR